MMLMPEEEAIIAFVARDKRRELTEQEVWISLMQARAIGEL